MAQLIDIQRVEVGLENLTARVRLADSAPRMTSEDLQGTTRIYKLLPHIIEHACMGDAGDTFKEAMGHTELAHLLEHVTVELLAQTNIAGDVSSGRTYPIEGDDRLYDVRISCTDDVLTAGALSSAAWIMDWAYSGGAEPVPDVKAIVHGLNALVQSLGEEPAHEYKQQVETQIAEQYNAEYRRLKEQRQEEIAQAREAAFHKAEEAVQKRSEEERLAREKAERERDARREAERLLAQREAELRRIELERERAEEARREAERLVAEVYAAAQHTQSKFSPEALQSSQDEPVPEFLVQAAQVEAGVRSEDEDISTPSEE